MPPSIPGAKHLPGHPATVFESTTHKWSRLPPWAQLPCWEEQCTSWNQWGYNWSYRYRPYTRQSWSDEAWTSGSTSDLRHAATTATWADNLPADANLSDTTSAAVHAVRANIDAQTVCGWSCGLTCRRSRLRRTTGNHALVESLTEVSRQLICKNCPPQERAAAAARDRPLEPLSGNEGDLSE